MSRGMPISGEIIIRHNTIGWYSRAFCTDSRNGKINILHTHIFTYSYFIFTRSREVHTYSIDIILYTKIYYQEIIWYKNNNNNNNVFNLKIFKLLYV